MQSHVHFQDRFQVVQEVTNSMVLAYDGKKEKTSRTLSVIGIAGTFTKKVKDYLLKVPVRKIFDRVLQDETQSQCAVCKSNFLMVIKQSELEMSLRIMAALQRKNLPCSCEYIGFSNESKTIFAFMRKSASIKTQNMCIAQPAYLGSFEEICEVEQRQFAITCKDAKKPVLTTWHLAECVAVAGFEKSNNIGFLFHVDTISDFPKALEELRTHLRERHSELSFDVLVLGGFTDDISFCQYANRRDSIVEELLRHKDSDITFNIIPSKNIVSLRSLDVQQDSYWSRSTRLARSIAFDTRLDDPFSALQSYEPSLYPESSFHSRLRTTEEASAFENSDDPTMKMSVSLAD